ncbi:MAG: DNA starvation/stationary phase protection protein Dps [Myxococcota bacterium]
MTKHTMDAGIRKTMIELLNARLVDSLDLGNMAKQAHWNVKGPSFIALHELFDAVHGHAEEWSDLIAERAVALGGTATGTTQQVGTGTTLAPYPTEICGGRAHVDALSSALAAYGDAVRKAIAAADGAGDADTADLFTEVSRAVDKDLWFVEAHLHDA